jgi:hypothetical protein
MDFDNDKYLELLECVQDFGKNDELIKKCFNRLKLVKEKDTYEGIDLMQAINKMNPKPAYQQLINKVFDVNGVSISQRQELIKEFIKEKNRVDGREP